MRLQFQILVAFFVFRKVLSSEHETVNSNVAVGGTMAPANSITVAHGTTVAPAMATTTAPGNAPTLSTILLTGTIGHSSNSTVPTPKASTKFPETCQSLDTLEQSQQCYMALEGIDALIGSISLTDEISITLMQDYCETFGTCYPEIEKCAEFDPYSITILQGFCDFYQFVTSSIFLNCARDMETKTTPCTDNATETIMSFNGTTAVKCAKLTAISSCTVQEVRDTCNLRAEQSYQMFINRHIQTWMC
ncbi:hypothetical protein L3Y34_009230 [Caenorhabditis briggsae]|uniref:T20D4.11-like domain-containing protein n=2 Tax=Caenorhabditis briggsae TaxID=6238 RepID=A0AAE9A587_CAEBR|nr:hypothetical protein L3Y34_009230 [Caenorhabditis briggsae]